MFDLKSLSENIQHNCHISDALYAGHYTMCIFLLKMREYYRWEKGFPLSQSLPRKDVGNWLTAREDFWNELDDQPFAPITLNNEDFDPFASRAINAYLNPLGYVYSGGVGLFHKPYFFLGKLEKQESHHGINLLVSSEEYARDLIAPPAMLLDDTVFIRKESLRRAIWERIEEWRLKKRQDTPMARALTWYQVQQNMDDDMEAVLDHLTNHETEAVFLHESGEAMVSNLLGPQWEELLASLPRSRAELLARAVRDHLADCLSTLPVLLETENTPSLHFYFANFTGMRRELFPEAFGAYQCWVDSGSLSSLKRICDSGREHWQETAQQILSLYRAQTDDLEQSIEKLCCIST